MPSNRQFLIAAGLTAVAVAALSGGSGTDPRTPPGLPGLPPPFFGTAVIGGGGRAGAVDAYGDLVDLRAPGPAGRPQIEVSPKRLAAGSVAAGSVKVARVRVGGGGRLPLWQADAVTQHYLRGTNVLVTVARFGRRRLTVVRSIGGRRSARADRRWIARARPLGPDAPRWAHRLYERSLLVLRALTDRRTGAVAAGLREGWAYVWPRDAGAVAMALASAGYHTEARRVARFLLALDLGAAARFDGEGAPVSGRGAQGDAAGWAAAAARAAGLDASVPPETWRNRSDYQERVPGDYLANALASTGGHSGMRNRGPNGAVNRQQPAGAPWSAFETRRGLVRVAGDDGSGLDSSAAWAVRPFPQPGLRVAARRTLLKLAAESGRFGLLPSENWSGGEDPWTAPTAWTAWGLACLGERRPALRLVGELRRAATPLDLLPERVDAQSGAPRSTTPLAWSHAFTILALRTLWPAGRSGG